MLTSITISDQYVNEILSIVGYPLLNFEDNNFELTKDQFKQLIVLPAMRVYFMYFPKKLHQEFSVGSSFEIAYPDESVYGVLDARINNSGRGSSGSVTSNPLINARNITSNSRMSGNVYGTGNDYGITSSSIVVQGAYDSMVERYTNERIYDNQEERRVEGYTNSTGRLNVTWAKVSDNFDTVPFQRKDELIKLCQAGFLTYLGNLRGQLGDAGLPVNFNYDDFKDLGTSMRDEVVEIWKKHSKIVIIKA